MVVNVFCSLKKFSAYCWKLLATERRWIKKSLKIIWVLFFLAVTVSPLYVYLVMRNPYNLFGGMPTLKDIENPQNDLSSEVVSADGVSLGRFIRYNRSQVTYEELPEVIVKTLIISEDHRFYEHSGMDLWSYLRVVYGVITLNNQGGGSTLTQQTAKNLFRTREEELRGKLANLGSPFELLISKTKEWIIAVRLEQNFTKEEIIALYLNTVSFNYNAFGVKVAAETYFNKKLKELTIQEAALLIGMLQGTHRYNPVEFPERARIKRNQVMNKLFRHHYIESQTELDSLKALPLQLNFVVQNHNSGPATYFRSVLKAEMMKWCNEHGYDLFESGLKIYTTIDSRMQRFAEESMVQHMRKLQREFDHEWGGKNPWVDDNKKEIKDFLQRKIKQTESYRNLVKIYGERSDSIEMMLKRKKPMRIFTWDGERDTLFSSYDSIRYYNKFLHTGLFAMNPLTGEVKAWVGGINHKYFKYDHVHQGRRQPGSTFKAFVFGKAIEEGYSPCQLFFDQSPFIDVGSSVYHPTNSNGTYGDGNPYTMRQALAKSLNSITIQLMDRMQPENVASFANKVGIMSKLDPVYSLGLGTSDVALDELVAAYCGFVNSGVHTKPFYITRIEDKHGNVIENFIPQSKQVMSEETAYKMLYMLKGGIEEEGGTSRGMSSKILEGNEVAGKTGTTDDASDGWYVGMTHNLVTGIWVGGNERSIHFPSWTFGSGGRSALPLWEKFMQKIYSNPSIGYQKGYFKKHETQEFFEDCSQYNLSDSTYMISN
jgi:penicillin-binding protein 1A